MYEIVHYPKQEQYDFAARAGVRVPPMELVRDARTAGGAYRRLLAQYRREMDIGAVNVPSMRISFYRK